jgi:hypothetical protein
MRALRLLLVLGCGLLASLTANAATAKIVKVLPHYIDLEGRVALSPSLYERDAYQALLRTKPERRSGLRFDVEWKASTRAPLTLRVELRGTRQEKATTAMIEATVKHRGLFSKWAAVELTGDDYKLFGELRAWRATLWDGPTQMAEQKSFLW